jgi:hypothetical protein
MTSNQTVGKHKSLRTRITDLAEIAVELSAREMRIVSGGLAPFAMACAPNIAQTSGSMRPRTGYITGGDHDSD